MADSILKRWDNYFESLDKFFELSLKIQESQLEIIKKLEAMEQKLSLDPDRSFNSETLV